MNRTIATHNISADNAIMSDCHQGLLNPFELGNEDWSPQATGLRVSQEDAIAEWCVQLADNVYTLDWQYNLILMSQLTKIVKTNADLEYYNPRLTTNCMIVDNRGLTTRSFNVATEPHCPSPIVPTGQAIKLITPNLTLYSNGKLEVKGHDHHDNVVHAHYESGCLVMIRESGELVTYIYSTWTNTLKGKDDNWMPANGSTLLTVPHTSEKLVHVVCSLCYTNSQYIAICVTEQGRLVLVKLNGDCEPLYHEHGVVKEVRCDGHSLRTLRRVVQNNEYRPRPDWCVLVSVVIVDSYDSTLVDVELVVKSNECVVTRTIVTRGVVSASSLVGVAYPNINIKGAEE